MSAKLPPPNYTQLPNIILDNLRIVSDAELRVLLVVSRQTFGFHRDSHKLSISFVAKAAGMSEQGVINGTKSLMGRGLLAREKDGDGFLYSMVVGEYPPPNGVEDPSQRRLGQPINGVEAPPPNGVEGNKETEKKKGKKAALPPTRLEIQAKLSACEAYRGIDVAREMAKAEVWLATHPGRRATERFYVNWLNKCEPTVTMSGSNGHAPKIDYASLGRAGRPL